MDDIPSTLLESQRDVEAELLSRVCSDVETVLQDLCREQLSRESNKDERLISMHVGSGTTNDRHSLMSELSPKCLIV